MSAIVAVGARLVTVRHEDGRTGTCSWDALRSAAEQDDPTLRAAYAVLLRQAEAEALERSPLVVCYGQDSTNVWWHAWVETAWGQIHVGRTWRNRRIVARDEGGTLPQPWLARAEAEWIAARIEGVDPAQHVLIRRVSR